MLKSLIYMPYKTARTQRVTRKTPANVTPRHRHKYRTERELKELSWADSTGRCAYCAKDVPRDLSTADHVHPRIRGGNNSSKNRVNCCRSCNLAKGDLTVVDWFYQNRSYAGAFLILAPRAHPWLRRTAAEIAIGPYLDEDPVTLPLALKHYQEDLEDLCLSILEVSTPMPPWAEQLGERERWTEPRDWAAIRRARKRARTVVRTPVARSNKARKPSSPASRSDSPYCS